MKKRIVSVMLCVCMLLSLFTVNVMSSDSNVSTWAQSEVAEAISNNLVPAEMMNDDFTQNITRAEFSAIAIQLLKALWGKELTWHGGHITDIADNPYAEYIQGAYAYGITNGTGGNETAGIIFSPGYHITREQLATMMLRVIKLCIFEEEWIATGNFNIPLNLGVTQSFADDDKISVYAREAAYYMNKIGIIKGVDETYFAPNGTATKEQAICIAQRILNSRDIWSCAKKDNGDYETAYVQYLEQNSNYFAQGMILCDLNKDSIPELFSLDYGTTYLHPYQNGRIIPPAQNARQIYIDTDMLINPATHYEDPYRFFGLYTDKTTGQNVLINANENHSEENCFFDIIGYDGSQLNITNEYTTGPIVKKVDDVMANYTPSKDQLYTKYLLRGVLDKDNVVNSFKSLCSDFKQNKNEVTYGEATDGSFDCYIKNIDMDNKEIEFVVAKTITLEQYNQAINSDGMFEIDGQQAQIKAVPEKIENTGTADVFMMPWFEYPFYVPTEQSPVSVIRGYWQGTPIKVKYSHDMIVRHGVLGYDADGHPVGAQSKDGKEIFTSAEEYFSNFAKYSYGSNYRIHIQDNQAIILDVMYRP